MFATLSHGCISSQSQLCIMQDYVKKGFEHLLPDIRAGGRTENMGGGRGVALSGGNKVYIQGLLMKQFFHYN